MKIRKDLLHEAFELLGPVLITLFFIAALVIFVTITWPFSMYFGIGLVVLVAGIYGVLLHLDTKGK